MEKMNKYKIAHFGIYEADELDLEIIAIYENNLENLKKILGKNINKIIKIHGEYGEKFTPLEMALYLDKKDIIQYLVDKNATTKKGKYHKKAIQIAVRYCDPETVMLFKKDLEVLSEDKKEELFQEIFYGEEKFSNINALEKIGITIKKYGGLMLRKLASENDMEWVSYFLIKGADINYHKSDMIFPYASTPVIEAARNNNYDMVKILVQQGADITIKDNDGDRPYTLAIQNNNSHMSNYLKKFEPKIFHNLENKKQKLKNYKLPEDLVNFLNGDQFTFTINDKYCKFIRFYSFTDTVETKWKGKKVLSLVAEIDNYSTVDIVWYGTDKMIYAIDEDHETFTSLGTWDYFHKNMEKCIRDYLNGNIN